MSNLGKWYQLKLEQDKQAKGNKQPFQAEWTSGGPKPQKTKGTPSPQGKSSLGTRLASSSQSLSLQPAGASSPPPLPRAPAHVAGADAVEAEDMEPTKAPVAKGELSQGVSNDFRAPLLWDPSPLWDRLLQAPPPSLEGTTVCHTPDLLVGGRLTEFLPFWRQLTQDPWVLSVIQRGYVFPLKYQPRLTGKRITRLSVSELCKEVEGLFTKCAVEPVPQDQLGMGFYSTYFVVPKKDGGLRPILNLKPFNKSLHRVRFKMETLRTVIAVVQQGIWLASVDLDAYLHVPVREQCGSTSGSPCPR